MKHLKLVIFTILISLLVPSVVYGAFGWAPDPEDFTSECRVNSEDPYAGRIGCRCGHTIFDDDVPFKVKCERTDFVCSTNAYNANPFTVCLYRIGRQPEQVIDENDRRAACEGGASYDKNSQSCMVDIGDNTLGGTVGSSTSDIRNTIRRFINVALGFLGIVTVVMIIYGGFNWLTAAGSDEKIDKGKRIILWAAIGAIVISIAWTISSYVLKVGQAIG